MSKTVQISDAVAKALADSKRTADDVLRETLKIKVEGFSTDGIVFPEGTAFLAWYKERPYWGFVKNGQIDIQGKRFPSVSAAACEITKRPTTNGWDFWQCKLPGRSEFIRISKLRSEPSGS